MAFFFKKPKRESVFVGVAARETLVGHIKERVMLLLLEDLADLFPLILGRIDARWVVRARMQQYDALVWGRLEVRNHTFQVKPHRFLLVILILDNFEAGIAQQGFVVRPAWCRNVNLLAVGIESIQKFTTNPQSAGTRNRLSDCYPVFLYDSRIFSVRKERRSFRECWNSSNTRIFLVQFRRNHLFFSCANRW